MALRKAWQVGMLAMVLVCGVCVATQAAEADGKLRIAVTIEPLKYVVDRVGGEHVEVFTLVPPGKSPATYQPTPRQLREVSKGQAYFRVGVGMENALVPKIEESMPELPVFDVRDGLKLIEAPEHVHADDDDDRDYHHDDDDDDDRDYHHDDDDDDDRDYHHDDDDDDDRDYHDDDDHDHHHAHDETDPHVWLSPVNLRVMAKHICEELVELDPAHKEKYEANLKSFQADLDALHTDLKEQLASLAGNKVYVYHPAYGYMAETYGFEQVSLEVGGKEPSGVRLKEFIDHAKDEGIRVIFVQKQFARKTARVIADAVQAEVVELDPLAYDVVSSLRSIAAQFTAQHSFIHDER